MRGAFIVPQEDWPAALASGVEIVQWHGEPVLSGLMSAWFDSSTGEPVMTQAVDEPDLRGIAPGHARLMCEAGRVGNLPTFTVIGNNYRDYRDVADVIGVDIYPYTRWFPWEPWNLFNWFTSWQGRRKLARAKEALRGKTWFGVIQAHSTSHLRMPSLREFKKWEDLFLSAGAVGVMAFAWADGDHWQGNPALIKAAWG